MKLPQIVKKNWPLFIILFVVIVFFYKTIFYSQIPFPGDLLVGQYEPYKSYSYFGIAPGGVPNKAQGPDVIKELIPWKKFVIENLKHGQIPLWNPYNFSGNPLIANFQSGVFYPTNILFVLLNFESAWSIYIILAPLLAGCFTYLFLRRLKVSEAASIFGSLVFAFSSYSTVWMEYGNIGHTFVWLPLILYFSDKFLERINARNFFGIVLSSLAAILAGYIQGVFYIYLIALVYFLIKGVTSKKLKLLHLASYILSLIIPIGLSAFQILPTLELFGQSSRGNYTIDQIQKMLNPIYYLITVLVPDFFGNPATRNYWLDGTYIERVSYFGLIPLMLAVFGFLTLFKKIEVKIFSLLFLGSLIISTDLFVTRFFYLLPIPVLSTTVATRILSVFAFSGSVLAAFGFEHFLNEKNKRTIYYIAGSIFIVLLTLFVITIFHSTPEFKIAQRNLIIPIVTLFLFIALSIFKSIKANFKTILIVGIFLITFADLFYYFTKITPFAPYKFLYPSTPVASFLKKNQGIDRSWGYGSGYIESNFQTYERIYSTEGNDPLHVKEYTELVAASKNGRIPDVLPRPDANIAGGFGKEELARNPFRQKVLDILGVKYILQKDESLIGDFNPDSVTFPADRYKLDWQAKPWQVYENLKATPRILLTNRYRVVSDQKKVIGTLFDSDFDEKTDLVLNEDPKVSQGKLEANSKLISYEANKVSIQTVSSAPALLFLSDTFYPGWEASVDGVRTIVFRADYAFRAVVVPAGKHIIVFEYKPKTFYYGIYISMVTIVILLYCSIVIKKKYGVN